jgi:hypothetical protein
LRLVLEGATAKRTQVQIAAVWPPDSPRPSGTTLWRSLDTAVKAGRVCRDGAGGNGDPLHYWLADKEASFRADPLQQVREEERELLRRLRGAPYS